MHKITRVEFLQAATIGRDGSPESSLISGQILDGFEVILNLDSSKDFVRVAFKKGDQRADFFNLIPMSNIKNIIFSDKPEIFKRFGE